MNMELPAQLGYIQQGDLSHIAKFKTNKIRLPLVYLYLLLSIGLFPFDNYK